MKIKILLVFIFAFVRGFSQSQIIIKNNLSDCFKCDLTVVDILKIHKSSTLVFPSLSVKQQQKIIAQYQNISAQINYKFSDSLFTDNNSNGSSKFMLVQNNKIVFNDIISMENAQAMMALLDVPSENKNILDRLDTFGMVERYFLADKSIILYDNILSDLYWVNNNNIYQYAIDSNIYSHAFDLLSTGISKNELPNNISELNSKLNFSMKSKLMGAVALNESEVSLLMMSAFPHLKDTNITIKNVLMLVTLNKAQKKIVSIDVIDGDLTDDYYIKPFGFTIFNNFLYMHVYTKGNNSTPYYYLAKFHKKDHKYSFTEFLNFRPSEIYTTSGLYHNFNSAVFSSHLIAEDRGNRILDLKTNKYFYFKTSQESENSVHFLGKSLKSNIGNLSFKNTYMIQDLCFQKNRIGILINDWDGSKTVIILDYVSGKEINRYKIPLDTLTNRQIVIKKLDNTLEQLIVHNKKDNSVRVVPIESLLP